MKMISSPLEDAFDIESGSTMSMIQGGDVVPHQPQPSTEPDAEDVKVSRQLDTVYDYALESFEAQHALQQTVDPKFAARNAEVAAQFLKIALDATESRAKNKLEKDKLRGTSSAGPQTVNNNLILTDRKSVLAALRDANTRSNGQLVDSLNDATSTDGLLGE
jgi:hypothetical protein